MRKSHVVFVGYWMQESYCELDM